MASENESKPTLDDLDALVDSEPSIIDQQVQDLQDRLEAERDARLEDRFVFILMIIILFDIVFFTLMDSFGGPLALLILELIILIPLAGRMGVQEIVTILSNVLGRMANSIGKRDD